MRGERVAARISRHHRTTRMVGRSLLAYLLLLHIDVIFISKDTLYEVRFFCNSIRDFFFLSRVHSSQTHLFAGSSTTFIATRCRGTKNTHLCALQSFPYIPSLHFLRHGRFVCFVIIIRVCRCWSPSSSSLPIHILSSLCKYIYK